MISLARVARAIPALLGCVPLLGCSEVELQPPLVGALPEAPLMTLVEEASYGIEGVTVGDTATAGGGALAQIAKAVDLEDGTVVVLDQGFKKISIFGADGTFQRNILGGLGEGPGEFVFPTSLAVGPTRDIAVFDYRLNRLTLFSFSGEVIRTFLVPRTKEIALTAGTVLGTYMPDPNWVAWTHIIGGNETRPVMRVDDAHAQFYPRGSIARVASAGTDRILVAHHRPGLWTYWPGDGEWRGHELLAGYESMTYPDGMVRTPGYSIGVGQLSGGRVAIAYVQRDLPNDENEPIVVNHFIEVFGPDGRSTGRVILGSRDIPSFATSKDGETVLVALADPYPRVVRYGLRPCVDCRTPFFGVE
jgi:6-bladed beta-propeller protein